ncbi:hypothetical protein [Streptomyces sp. TUS-ST3]|uniref:hypothetical protein n=1 Tax=Streptomyces sp. TUS-ST3 TaxID=3025591 RepID=UPI0032EA621C
MEAAGVTAAAVATAGSPAPSSAVTFILSAADSSRPPVRPSRPPVRPPPLPRSPSP